MKTDILFFVDNGMSDNDLTFDDIFVPLDLAGRLESARIIDSCWFSIPGTYSGRLTDHDKALTRKDIDDVDFWKEIFAKTGADHVVRIAADSPFMDPSIVAEMLDLHRKYLAEFTYSDNLPAGLTCEIVSRSLIEAIPDMEKKTLPLSQVVRSNINQFDVELYYRDPDIRDKRLAFRCGDAREKAVMQNIKNSAGRIPPYEDLRKIIDKTPSVLFTGPSYLELELSGRCDLKCLFCYRQTLQEPRGDMTVDLFRKILADMKEFHLPYTLCLGGSGEPLMHEKAVDMLGEALREPLIKQVIVETNGLYMDGTYRGLAANDEHKKLLTIVNINGHDGETYAGLHGEKTFERVRENIEALRKEMKDDDKRLYVQIMKINETEAFLDSYYDYWEKGNIPIILQKQNTWLGRIMDRRYSDLTPLERTPCWHLQRDLFILSDGTVSFCKQDVDGSSARGNASGESLKELWARARDSFENDYSGTYPARPDCASCDEWYTFNF